MSTLEQQLMQLLKGPITALGYHYLGMQRVAVGRRTIVRIYIDSDAGISVEDCAKVSRQVSAILDVEDPVGTTYHLEVSSPGLYRPLFTADHYACFLGQEICLVLHTAVENQCKWRGILQAVRDETVIITVNNQPDNQQKAFDLGNIREANLVPHF